MGVICVIGKECWATEYRNLYLQYCPIALLRLLFIYIPTQCVNVFFPYSFANRSDFWFFCKYNRRKMGFWCSWLGFYCSGVFCFCFGKQQNIYFIHCSFDLCLFYEWNWTYFSSCPYRYLLHNEWLFACFLLSVYICVTYSTLLYLHIKDGSPLWYEWWIIFPACQLSFGSAGNGFDVQTCIFSSEISSHFSYSVRISCHRKKDFPWAEYKKFSCVFPLVLLWLTLLILKTSTFGIYPEEWYEGCIQLYFLTKK